MADQGLYPAPVIPPFLPGRSSKDGYLLLPGLVIARVIDPVPEQEVVGMIPEPGVAGDSSYIVNKEYYIVYYGTTTPANLTSQTPFLKDMIAQTYRYDHLASMDALPWGAE
jgi:hypothetical protein